MNHDAAALWAAALTVAAFIGGRRLERRWRWFPTPLTVPAGIALLLLLLHLPYASYAPGGRWISFWLGPATVALAVPLYQEFHTLKAHARGVVLGVFLGSLIGMGVSGGVVWLAGGDPTLVATMVPKSVTTPIALGLIAHLGGIPALGAVFTVATGIFGSVFGLGLLRLAGVRSEIARGTAMGTGASGIGTARMFAESRLGGGVAGFAMAFSGVVVSLATIPLGLWIH